MPDLYVCQYAHDCKHSYCRIAVPYASTHSETFKCGARYVVGLNPMVTTTIFQEELPIYFIKKNENRV
jgi:hypothetical protein